MERYKIWKATRVRDVEKDAANGVRTVKERCDEAFGPKPVFSPETNLEHAAIERECRTCDELVADLEAAVDASGKALRSKTPFWIYGTGMAVGLTGDTLGSILTLKAAGVALPGRVLLGVSLAILLFVGIWGIWELAQPRKVTS